jgi:hypothetical protein
VDGKAVKFAGIFFTFELGRTLPSLDNTHKLL